MCFLFFFLISLNLGSSSHQGHGCSPMPGLQRAFLLVVVVIIFKNLILVTTPGRLVEEFLCAKNFDFCYQR